MTKPNRRMPRYERRAEVARRAATEAERSELAAAAAIHRGMLAAAERERWAGVPASQRVHVVKPFGLSTHHGINEADLRRFMEIKGALLGYQECVVRERDEDKVYEFPGHPGSVAGQGDADRLIAALAGEYPAIPFRVELSPYVADQVEWVRSAAESGAAPDTA